MDTRPMIDSPPEPSSPTAPTPLRPAMPDISPLVPPALTTEVAARTLADKVQGHVEHDVCGSLPDLEAAALNALPERHVFDTGNYFLDLLDRACQRVREHGEPMELRGLRWPMQVRQAGTPQIYLGCKDAVLRPFCVIRLEPGAVTPVIADSTPPAGGRWMRAEDVLWNVALWTSRGRLPKGTDPRQPQRLMAWPNFTRVAAVPNAMRICALWSRETISPVDVARRLQLPQRVVFTFYSAAVSAGLMEAGSARPEAAAPPAAPEPRRRSLFARILRTLTHAR